VAQWAGLRLSLDRAGLKVTIREAGPVVGGAAVAEEFHLGFRNPTAS
jgi:phytoene dehydrogenase-like protein